MAYRTSKLIGKNKTELIAQDLRLSYPHLISPDTSEMGGGKYVATFLWPKDNEQLTALVKEAINNAIEKGVEDKGKDFARQIRFTPVKDGDEYAAKKPGSGDVYKGHWYLKAKSSKRPKVVDRNRELIIDEADIPPGSFVNADLYFYPFSTSGNKGITCALNQVQKIKCREEDRFDTTSSVDVFDIIEDEEDDLGF